MRRIAHVIHAGTMSVVLLGVLLGTAFLFSQGVGQPNHAAPATLVQHVLKATVQFLDINNAVLAGYGPAFGCVSGPDHGAMGIHYVNGNLLADGELDVTHPEALIYEPVGSRRRLVG